VNCCCVVSSGTQLSQSGDERHIHPLSESQQRILSRHGASSVARGPLPAASSSMHSRQGHHSIRATLGLDIPQPMRPAADSEAVVVDVEPTLSSDLEERVRDWDFIGRSLLFILLILIILSVSECLSKVRGL